jgi:hypothetical protein
VSVAAASHRGLEPIDGGHSLSDVMGHLVEVVERGRRGSDPLVGSSRPLDDVLDQLLENAQRTVGDDLLDLGQVGFVGGVVAEGGQERAERQRLRDQCRLTHLATELDRLLRTRGRGRPLPGGDLAEGEPDERVAEHQNRPGARAEGDAAVAAVRPRCARP